MTSSVLQSTLTALRRRWRARTAGRALRRALLLGAVALLLLWGGVAVGLVPPGARPGLRWLVPVAGGVPLAWGLLQLILRVPSDRRLALQVDERHPDLEHGAVTLLELSESHPYARAIRDRVEAALSWSGSSRGAMGEGDVVRRIASIRTAGSLVPAALALGVLVAGGGPLQLWSEWGRGGPAGVAGFRGDGSPAGGAAVEGEAAGIDLPGHLRIEVHPPAYTGRSPYTADFDEGVEALAGSTLRLVADLPPEVSAPRLRRVTTDRAAVRDAKGAGRDVGDAVQEGDAVPEGDPEWEVFRADADGQWVAELTVGVADRGIVLRHAEDWILPLAVVSDGPPVVELLEPERDLVLADGSGRVTVRARARDSYGIEDFDLDWVHTRGSGESFDFRDGAVEWESVGDTGDGTVEGRLALELDEIGMGPGDVLHLRAGARDVNDVTGPGEGVSQTRQIRVIREGEEMAVDALLGLPLEAEREPVLSQRMILLMTEALVAAAPSMSSAQVRDEARRIGREQNRLRTQIGEAVFSRATGAMEEVVMHLGVELDPAGRAGEADAHGHDTGAVAPGAADTTAADSMAAPPDGSRYGVASIFDPATERDSVPALAQAAAQDSAGHRTDSAATEPDEHAHADTRGDPLDFGADAAVSPLLSGRPGEIPTGFGVLEELGHDHDGDPILSVNQPLLEIYNAMWDAERRLGLIEPGGSVPHQIEALEGLQALRENERVFARGRVTVPPVDVDAVRGEGEIDDAAPAPRSQGAARASGREHLAELDRLLVRLREGGPGGVGAELHRLALALLEDPAVSAEVSSRVVRASARLRQGAGDEARELLIEARRGWLGGPEASGGRFVANPSGVVAGRGWERGADDEGAADGDADDRNLDNVNLDNVNLDEGGEDERADPMETSTIAPARPFIFATVRYESGNWDSAPLVPQNLIHSLAQYTELPVAPEGVVVDLSSEEVFRYPVLYLTGHLPVRFSQIEARNLERYVARGGFVFIDDHNHDVDGAFHRTATSELGRIFGEDALEPLPTDHELYRSFFHFDDGPPTTSHELSGWGDGLIHPELHAVRVDGRIGVLYSNKDYASEWSYHAVNKRFLAEDNTRFGVNVLIYALTR